jgi:hypothetical protein
LQLDDVFDRAGHVFAPVNEVAQEDEGVASRVAREGGEQMSELRAASVNVADDEGAQTASPAGSWPLGASFKFRLATEDTEDTEIKFQITDLRFQMRFQISNEI